MFKRIEILDEKDKTLRQISKDVTSPLSKEECKLIKDIITYLTYSQIEKMAEKYKLRPGMGMAFPQVNILKRVIIIVYEYSEGKFENYVVVNPRIVSTSKELIAAEAGEGCLSVNRDVEGHVVRFARVTIEGEDIDGNMIRIRAREELAIAFQHEIDHLNGILFYDHINKDKPFVTDNSVRLL